MTRVYVANLEKYNANTLHGEWVDLTEEDIHEAIQRIAPGVDWAIHDYDDCINLGEHPSLEELAAVGELYTDYDSDAIIAAWAITSSISELGDLLEQGWGVYESLEDWAREYVEDCCELPELALRYFDYEAFARDAQCNGSVTFVRNGSELFAFTP